MTEENINLEDLLKEDIEEEEFIQILLNRAVQQELDINKLKISNNEYERSLVEVKKELVVEKGTKETAENDLKAEKEARGKLETERDARPNITNDEYRELQEELTKLKEENENLCKDKELRDKLTGLKKEKRENRMKLLKKTQETMDKIDEVFSECKILVETPPK